jgi:hypothetical protein
MRFSGSVGFVTNTETAPGVWSDVITERFYYGNVVRNSSRLGPPLMVPPEVNNNLSLGNSFSLVGDAEAYENFMHIRYVRWQSNVWTITDVEVVRPRLILTIGGLWNGNTA